MQCNLTACCTPVQDALNAVVKGCSTSTTLDCTCLLTSSQEDKCAGLRPVLDETMQLMDARCVSAQLSSAKAQHEVLPGCRLQQR